MSAMEELEGLLQSLQALKPPGVTKTKIEAITALCVGNVQSDSIIVQKIFQQFKKSPTTHKLGVLYVLDSVTRQWVEKAKQAGQVVSHNAPEGTFASGVQKVTDVLPALMNELIQTAPENQREKVSKLIDIWERGQTFPLDKLRDFKQKLSSLQNAGASSYTPPGSPPNNSASQGVAPQPQVSQIPPAPPASATPDTASILAALANLSRQNAPTTAQGNMAPAAPTASVAPFNQAVAPVAQSPFAFQQPIVPPPPAFVPPTMPTPQAAPSAPPAGGQALMNQIFQAMAAGMVPADQALAIMTAITASQNAGAAPVVAPPAIPATTATQPPSQPSGLPPDRYDHSGSRYRGRSRSPDYNRRRAATPERRSPPNRRDSPTYGTYDGLVGNDGRNGNRNDYERGRGRGRNRGRNDFRQRTPPRRQTSPSAHRMQPKFIDWDNTLPRDHIRVLSRTLFVGGANGSEAELRAIFNRFGTVQTCIVNHDKRHAFVKMVNRQDAVAAKEGMDKAHDPEIVNKARQTRWGVGFGPRDCSDYTNGISVIPINRLTDADRKWVLTAEYGGTGGEPIQSGMVIEEPDIEIGAGVSSKAISKRVLPDTGRRGGHNFGGRGGHDHNPRFNRRSDRAPEPRHMSPRPDATIGVPPPVPGFGFQLPLS